MSSPIVLRDGRVLSLSPEQNESLGMVILFSPTLDKRVKVGDQSFKLSDIVTDPQEILKVTQTKMMDVPAIPVKRKNSKELA